MKMYTYIIIDSYKEEVTDFIKRKIKNFVIMNTFKKEGTNYIARIIMTRTPLPAEMERDIENMMLLRGHPEYITIKNEIMKSL